ncbi:MAG TPA: 7TM-DISM domain-containing protein, partial [Sphingomonas sp.]|nr:7TM-DISM domain-containing protein [Sphingomonas sp.]
MWWLLAALALVGGVAPASADTFVRASYIRCTDTPDPRCPPPSANHGWVVLAEPQVLAALQPGWQLLVDQTRFSAITVEVATATKIYRIKRSQGELGQNWSLGDNLRFAVPVAGSDVRSVRIDYESPGDLGLMRTIKALSPEALANYESRWQATVALVAGLMACALIYSLFLMSWLRTPFQRWYVLWTAGAMTYMMLWSGVIYYAFPGLVGNATVRVDAFLAGALVGVSVLFFFALIEDHARDERLARAGRWAAGAGLATGVLAAFDQLIPIWLSDTLLNLAFIACNLVIIASIGVALRRRSRMVWYYLAAWLPMLMVFNLRIARNFDLVPQSDWVDLAGFIAIGFEVVLLSLAIADRVRLLNRDYAAADVERIALRSEALSDSLTGVRNRAYFQRRMDALEAAG